VKLRFFGLDHQNTSVELREKLAFDKVARARYLENWEDAFPGIEAVLVSTCNRTELYLGTLNGELPNLAELLRFAAEQKEEPISDSAAEMIRCADDADAASHLFAVASSLESMVLGEPQILAQIKEAYQAAVDQKTAGIVIHSVFQHALAAAKRISVETTIFRHRVSIPSVAVADFALELFESLADKTTLVLGAGEMAAETLQYLKDNGAKKILVANRTRSKADALAEVFSGTAIDWEERIAASGNADLIVAACSTQEPVLYRADLAPHQPKRKGRPLFLLDLAVPRNLDAQISRLENVYLYSLDDLAAACSRNRKRRDAELPKARKIIQQEANDFWRDMRLRESGETIRRLREQWHETKASELKRLFNKCSSLDEAQRQEISIAFDRLVNKMLHAPMESLREEIDEKPRSLLDAMIRLFRLP